ncbi:hypothetical protein KC343_g9786 [Hortaea werneckii]|uniref:Uncharacterized protein n=1 Tax=Hortaea werneckii TaxID=91943 RepID=A0A3M7ECJ4_HORWE|nr:hypothetical protein KC317_g9980 [Hortaea werneckii]KAI7616384.1 hypothetical protein KC343_g9786 [Hortaea werneckii]KAI7696546.1 hypothetical protein KC322_g9710 [Hortaea werneckii]RMY74369.1 hypothetical protein D0864_10031 [Hortaea werneckii]
MPPRVRFQPSRLRPAVPRANNPYICWQCRHASLASATTPAPPIEQTVSAVPPISRYPPTQPPSHKPPEFRKSQLHRQYQSLLRSSPLIVLFQHNNIKATEWSGIRRELNSALQKVDEELAQQGDNTYLGSGMKLQIVQTGIFASAMKVVEFWNPNFELETPTTHPVDPQTASSTSIEDTKPTPMDPGFRHGLSEQAYRAAQQNKKLKIGLEPLMSGPIALLTFPEVSPQHLKAALSILSPSKDFPAPKRRANPGYHEKPVQDGLQKLMLLGARVEGKVFDMEGARWIGGIPGGLSGLRAQLVAMLSGVGAGITNTLEAASKSLYLTMESRKTQMEEEGKPKEAGGEGEAKKE